LERQSKGSRGLEAYCQGGQGPPRAVAPPKKKNKKNLKSNCWFYILNVKRIWLIWSALWRVIFSPFSSAFGKKMKIFILLLQILTADALKMMAFCFFLRIVSCSVLMIWINKINISLNMTFFITCYSLYV
jgi:hypothetical protein